MLTTLLVIVALLAANAFFVAAEFALVKVRRFQLDQAALEGRLGGKLTVRIHSNLDAYLAACQLGITMASLGLGWVGEPAVEAVLAPVFTSFGMPPDNIHTISFLTGFILFSSLHITVGEQVPKTFAIRKPEPVSLWCAWPLEIFYWFSYPLNWLLNKANAGILKLMRIPDLPHYEILSEDEISSLVEKSAAHGELESDTAEIIRKVFAFDDRVVRDVMVPWDQVQVIDLRKPIEVNRRLVIDVPHSRFPVRSKERGEVIGFLMVKDLVRMALSEGGDFETLLTSALRDPFMVPASAKIDQLFERMRTERIHLAVVVDDYGAYTGIVTLEDLLEEIVGEIEDEWDIATPKALIEDSGDDWKVAGHCPLSEFEATTGLQLYDAGDSQTVAGYLMRKLQRIPVAGDEIESTAGVFQVLKMDRHRVASVSLKKRDD